jgi:hypothetical protein
MNDTAIEIVGEKIEQTVEKAEEIVRHPYIKNLPNSAFTRKAFFLSSSEFWQLWWRLGKKADKYPMPAELCRELPKQLTEKCF